MHEFYPTSFEIYSRADLEEFLFEFDYGLVVALLKKHFAFFNVRRHDLVNKFMTCLTRGRKPFEKVNNNNSLCLLTRHADLGFEVNVNLVQVLLSYLRHRVKVWDLDSHAPKPRHYLAFSEEEFESKVELLLEWNAADSQFVPFRSRLEGFAKEFYATPSDYLIYKICKYYYRLRVCEGSQWASYGPSNLWILKPCENSKGSGITVVRTKKEVLEMASSFGAKVVQRYLEAPFIFN